MSTYYQRNRERRREYMRAYMPAYEERRKTPCPECGGPKSYKATVCLECHRRARHPDDLTAAKRAAQKRYYEAHQAQYREYARARRALTTQRNPHLDACPECGRLKRKANDVCAPCNRKAHLQSELQLAKCWVCEVAMRPVEWHGQRFMRCPSCGLEISRPGLYAREEAA